MFIYFFSFGFIGGSVLDLEASNAWLPFFLLLMIDAISL